MAVRRTFRGKARSQRRPGLVLAYLRCAAIIGVAVSGCQRLPEPRAEKVKLLL